ncbi:MAG TPA: AI-2E family transporter [Casimicrobiaceae bacterium]|jgi:predicted PurR-regulated permease PerM
MTTPDTRSPAPSELDPEAPALLSSDVRPHAAAPPARRPLTLRHYVWIIGAALVVIAGLHWLGPVLTPFLVGTILAYLGTPIVDRAKARGIPRTLATTAVVLLFGLILAGLFFVLVPLVQAEFALAASRVPDLLALLSQTVVPWLDERFGIQLSFDMQAIRDFVTQNADTAQEFSLRVLAGVKTGGLIIVSVLINLALIPVVMFYVLRDWNMLLLRMDELLPRAWRNKAKTVARDIDAVLAEFLRGQVLVMIVLACYYAIGLKIAGLDRAFSIGILTGLLVFIPYVGFGLGLVLGVVAAALQWHGLPGFIAVLAVYGIGQLLENYVLIPWLIGDRIGLHPLAVIFALLAFGQLFGFAGILLALPVSAALLVGLRHLRTAYVVSPIYNRD